MAQALEETGGNPSSLHAEGQQARRRLEEARFAVARLACCEPDEVIFTSGGTEANRLALEGAARARPQAILVCGAADHPSVLGVLADLKQGGRNTQWLGVDHEGLLRIDELKCFEGHPGIFSLLWVSNEVGTIQPVDAFFAKARELGIILHVDAVQAAGKLDLQILKGADLLSLSSHKLGGPPGVGALILREGAQWMAPWSGGKQEGSRRPGTEAAFLIVGFAAACEVAVRDLDKTREHLSQTEKVFLDTLDQRGLSYKINGPHSSYNSLSPQGERVGVRGGVVCPRRLPGILNLSFPRWFADQLVAALDLEGVAASPGAACSSGVVRSSHVLEAMGRKGSEARRGVRFSWGPQADPKEAREAARRVARVVSRKASLALR